MLLFVVVIMVRTINEVDSVSGPYNTVSTNEVEVNWVEEHLTS